MIVLAGSKKGGTPVSLSKSPQGGLATALLPWRKGKYRFIFNSNCCKR